MRQIVHYRELTYRYLLQQRKRSMMTALGILLSVALIFSSGVMGATLKGKFLQNIKEQQGNYHVAFQNVTNEQIQALRANAKIEEVGLKSTVGFQSNPGGTFLTLIGADTGYLDMFDLHLKEGRLPRKDGEIALEQWYVDSMAVKPKLGDWISLDLTEGGNEPARQIPKKEARVQLTGIFKSKMNTQQSGMGYGVVTLDYAQKLRDPAGAEVDAAVRFKTHLAIQQEIGQTAAELGIAQKQVHPNTSLLTALGQSGDRSNNRALDTAEAIVIGIILFATIAVIYNAFHISVVERIRQFGLLRSIGMTPRQIRAIVFGEATLLATVAIPLGIAAGWAAVLLVLGLFGKIGQGTLFSAKMQTPWFVTAGSIALGLTAVYSSAFGPALTAGRISPLDAIVHQNRFRGEKATRRKQRWLSAFLGITGKMAYDNMKRNRRRYRITLFSMCIGIVLFIFFSSFMSFMTLAQSRTFTKDFGLVQGNTTAPPQFTAVDYQQVSRIPGIQKVYRVMLEQLSIRIPAGKQTADYRKIYGSMEELPVDLRGYRSGDFSLIRPRLTQGGMDANAMDRENGVVISQRMEARNGTITVSDYKVGDVITLNLPTDPQGRRKTLRLKVLGILDKTPLMYGNPEQFTVITTEQVFQRITGIADHYSRFDLTVDRQADLSVIKGRLEGIAETVNSARVLDFEGNNVRNTKLMIAILLYGLVAVISIISTINVINTISTNLILRTREFGMLRAIGMTMRQMRRMIVYESIGYGLTAALFGGAAGSLLSRLLFIQLHYVEEIPYHFPWMAIVASGLVAVLIGLLASSVPLRRMAGMNVVDAVRAEE